MTKIGKLMATGLLSLAMVITLITAMGCLSTYAASDDRGDLTISEVNFPDGNFRTWISQNLDSDKNGTLSDDEVEAVHEIDCTGAQIGDLNGIANFRNLQELRCGGNNMTELDLSNNTQLRSVTCTGNPLGSLNLGFLAQLETLYCSSTQLSSLDVSNCVNLKVLQCQDNSRLVSLTLGELPDLYEFYCYNVPSWLKMDFTGCPKLGYAYVIGNKTTEGAVATYTTDSSSEYGTAYLKLDKKMIPATGIKGLLPDGSVLLDPANFPSEGLIDQLKTYDTELGTEGRLSESERSRVTAVALGPYGESFDGIEYLPNLTQISYCQGYYNPPEEEASLNRLDLSNNPKIESICIKYAPKLKELDVSNLTELRSVDLEHTGIASLDFSANTKLADCRCYDSHYGNGLKSIDFGNNTVLEYAELKENKLTSLDLSGMPYLKEVYCNDNQLTSLNLKGCTSLDQINCYNNELSELDLDGLTSLRTLGCENNRLKKLDLSDCELLENFNCDQNLLTALDLENLKKLRWLYCRDNDLVKLSAKGCSALEKVDCQRNQLTNLDISGCSALRECLCAENKIATLDVSGSSTMLRLVQEGKRGISTGKIRYSGTFDDQSYELLIDDFTAIPGSPEPEQKPKKTISDAALSYYSCTYTGKAMTPSAIMVVVDGNPGLPKKDKDFTMTYKNNKNVGKATITFKGIGDYTGSFTKTFKINPKGTSLSKVTKAKKAATVKWKKQTAKMSKSRITGYQIQLATNSKFTKNKKQVEVKGYSKSSKKVTGLKGGKKYYVRIRTYTKVGSTTYYSPWSKNKTVTTGK